MPSWNEDDLRTLQEGGKVTRASVGYRMTGDVDGEAIDDAVMCYREDGTATVVGLWQMVGTAAGCRPPWERDVRVFRQLRRDDSGG